MNILYDHEIFAFQPYGGVSRYFSELIPRVAQIPGVDVSLFMGLHVNHYGLEKRRDIYKHFWAFRRPIRRNSYRVTRRLNQILFARFAARASADVYHATSYRWLARPADLARMKRVITVHDLTVDRFPHLAPMDRFNSGKKEAATAADGVICVSEATRRDLVESFGIATEKTTVVYHANSLHAAPSPRRPLDMPYLLFVGARGNYKNFALLRQAYAGSSFGNDLHLICAGGGSFAADEQEAAARLGIDRRVHHESPSDARLATLYAHAEALVYPSLAEGFGMPLLEAMHYGCPVIASNASCIPEIAGPAAVYFDPASVEDLREKIVSIFGDSKKKHALLTAGHAREATFTWEKAAQKSFDFYRQIAGS